MIYKVLGKKRVEDRSSYGPYVEDLTTKRTVLHLVDIKGNISDKSFSEQAVPCAVWVNVGDLIEFDEHHFRNITQERIAKDFKRLHANESKTK